jgi:hypothetical protein
MACTYDAKLFIMVTDEKSAANWGWFMQWWRKEVVGPDKIIIFSDQHLGIRAVFERSDFE